MIGFTHRFFSFFYYYNLIYIDIYIYHTAVFNLVVIMTENEKFYYVVYRETDDADMSTSILNQHPIDFVIEKENEVVILYSIEITEEQGRKYLDMVKDMW